MLMGECEAGMDKNYIELGKLRAFIVGTHTSFAF